MPALDDGQRRHAKYYVTVIDKVERLYLEGGLAIDSALRIFNIERPNIERGYTWAKANLNRDSEATSLSVQYVIEGKNILGLRLQASALIQWLEAGLLASIALESPQNEEDCHTALGLAFARLGETRKAIQHHDASLSIAKKLGDTKGEAIALGNLGSAFENLGQYKRALGLHLEALKLD